MKKVHRKTSTNPDIDKGKGLILKRKRKRKREGRTNIYQTEVQSAKVAVFPSYRLEPKATTNKQNTTARQRTELRKSQGGSYLLLQDATGQEGMNKDSVNKITSDSYCGD